MKNIFLAGAAALFEYIGIAAAAVADPKPTRHGGRPAARPFAAAPRAEKVQREFPSRRRCPAVQAYAGHALRLHQAR